MEDFLGIPPGAVGGTVNQRVAVDVGSPKETAGWLGFSTLERRDTRYRVKGIKVPDEAGGVS